MLDSGAAIACVVMGLVKTRRLAAMQKQQRAIHLRQGFHLRRGYGGRVGGLKAGMKLPTPKPARKCASFFQQPSKPPHTKSLPQTCSTSPVYPLRHISQYVKRRGMAVIGSVANVEVSPVPMLPISNWGLKTARRGRLAPPGGGGAMGASPTAFV